MFNSIILRRFLTISVILQDEGHGTATPRSLSGQLVVEPGASRCSAPKHSKSFLIPIKILFSQQRKKIISSFFIIMLCFFAYEHKNICKNIKNYRDVRLLYVFTVSTRCRRIGQLFLIKSSISASTTASSHTQAWVQLISSCPGSLGRRQLRPFGQTRSPGRYRLASPPPVRPSGHGRRAPSHRGMRAVGMISVIHGASDATKRASGRYLRKKDAPVRRRGEKFEDLKKLVQK